METPSAAQIHFAVRRLRRKAPAAIILIALLGETSAVEDEEVVQALVKLDLIKTTLHAAVERILAITAEPSEPEDRGKTAARKTGDAGAEGGRFKGDTSRESAPILSPSSV